MESITLFIIPVAVGIVIGVLSGMLGIGGGTIIVPTLSLGFGMSAVMATATSLFTIIPTSLAGAVSHIRHKTCIPSLGVAIGLGGALSSSIGVWLAQISPAWLIMSVAALVIAWSSYSMLSKAIKMPSNAATKSRIEEDKKEECGRETRRETGREAGQENGSEVVGSLKEKPAALKFSHKQLAIGAGIGLLAGVASGYVGVGGGFLMVPLMISVLGVSMKYAPGTSLIAIIILSTPAVAQQMMLGNIDYLVGFAIVIGSIPGALLGSKIGRNMPERALRITFGSFLMLAAVLLVISELGLLG